MHFQLLHGIHVEGGKKFEAKPIRNKDGSPSYKSQPVIKSDKDLALLFGTNKFRRLTNDQARTLLKAEADSSSESGSDDSEETVADAAKKGAADIGPQPFGKEVTEAFDGTEEAKVRVFIKNRKYTITDVSGEALMAESSLSKAEVIDFIVNHTEE